MRAQTLFRLAGLSAVAAALLRFFNAFFQGRFDDHANQAMYLVTDVLLLFGLLGVYLFSARKSGIAGFVGFLVSVSAILLIRTSAAQLLGPQTYMIGASVFSVGLAILGVGLLIGRTGFGAAAGFWLASLIVGVAGTLIGGQTLSFTLAVMLFCLGYGAAGLMLIVKSRTQGDAP